jgi:hypothetical protein
MLLLCLTMFNHLFDDLYKPMCFDYVFAWVLTIVHFVWRVLQLLFDITIIIISIQLFVLIQNNGGEKRWGSHVLRVFSQIAKNGGGRMSLGCFQKSQKKRWGTHVLRVLLKITIILSPKLNVKLKQNTTLLKQGPASTADWT